WAVRSLTPGRGLAGELRLGAAWPLDRQDDVAGTRPDPAHGVAEPDLAACFGQRFTQPLHQLVRRVDVVRTPAGQGGILQHHRFARRAELTAVILDGEV